MDFRRRGAKASLTSAAPMTLVANVLSNCSFRFSAREATPALLIRTSNLPNLSSTLFTAAAIDSSFVTSIWMFETEPLMSGMERMVERAEAPFWGEREPIRM